MNDTKRVDVETCISDLKEVVMDVLVEAKREGYALTTRGVRDRAGISEHFLGDESKRMSTPFTRALLLRLTEEGCVQWNWDIGPRHDSWEITDKGKLSMNDTGRMDVEPCLLELIEIICDVLVEVGSGARLTMSDIKSVSGIANQFTGDESKRYSTPFTQALLIRLKEQGRVLKHKKGKYSYWEITDEELSRWN